MYANCFHYVRSFKNEPGLLVPWKCTAVNIIFQFILKEFIYFSNHGSLVISDLLIIDSLSVIELYQVNLYYVPTYPGGKGSGFKKRRQLVNTH